MSFHSLSDKQFPTSNVRRNIEVEPFTKSPAKKDTDASQAKTFENFKPSETSTQQPEKVAWVEPPVVESSMDHRPNLNQQVWANRVGAQSDAITKAQVKKIYQLFPDKFEEM